ncbi:MAG: hypothetical protein IPL73_09115 [Candidatus Obscuribacter sp.]|nr:hypothetical protein [Candidatus Obscuribacter sp.]
MLTVVNQLFSGFDVAATSRAVNLFLDGCNLLLLFVLVLLLSGRGAVALSAMVIYGLSDYTIGEVVRGKEAPLLVMLMLGYLIFAASKMPRARATVAGLFALTHPRAYWFWHQTLSIRYAGARVLPSSLGSISIPLFVWL